MAKEIVVSTMSQVYLSGEDATQSESKNFNQEVIGVGSGFVTATINSGKILLSTLPGVDLIPANAASDDTALSSALQKQFTPLSAISMLVFVLLYVPCVATLGAIKHEFGTSWAVTSAVYQTAVAWIVAFMLYQGGMLLGFG